MPLKFILEDSENENQLTALLNKDGLCFIEVGDKRDDTGYYKGFITLEHDDVCALIKELQKIKKEM